MARTSTTRKSPTQKHGPSVRAKPASSSVHRVGCWCSSPRAKAGGCFMATSNAKPGGRRAALLGHIINHLVLDPRDGRTLLAAANTGHLGPDRVPLHRPGTPGRKRQATGVRETAGRRSERPRGEAHLLADAGPRE